MQPWLTRAAAASSAYFSAGTVTVGVISCGSSLGAGMLSSEKNCFNEIEIFLVYLIIRIRGFFSCKHDP